jgi:ABC-type amino acid transport substrate-binding protein
MINKKIEEENKELLQVYMWGFNDELNNKIRPVKSFRLILRAYELGRKDAIIGDDVRSVDYQTDEEIIKRIRTKQIGVPPNAKEIVDKTGRKCYESGRSINNISYIRYIDTGEIIEVPSDKIDKLLKKL